MKIGIMGGTFDPIHLGHMIAAESAREAAGLDEVWFIPTFIPPHKQNLPQASAEQRLAMVQLAVSDHPNFRAVDYELERGGASYTVDTVKVLRQLHPELSFYYIIGADMVMYLPKWVRIEEIMESVSFIGLQRPGFEVNLTELPAKLAAKVQLVEMPLIEISSTYIREKMRLRQSVKYLVCEKLRIYMEANQLYES
ncbi:nicotinate-nucleotide adenylyltransferase [Paenibacillus psychroresistens]|uniref:Probable nicotinate-nucleotide adenylyltransferase n=1 Tax=Paenibacillus psychroresistens TaxID=1778678 RepID=A0A6B8RIV0_9BACL|nr:nicotinate-nucleotide adenylyltransferase [Paenibacillus psychroresistens]QGQ95674.1 nicotinate-nucleotide adenylyltransferase [Paenibacillus psychroresistens]